jgi:putative transposase
MSRYRRANIEGGSFFFTLALADRSSDLLVCHVDRLRRAYKVVQERLPFETVAICILPDHLHALWLLPGRRCRFRLALESSQIGIFTRPSGFAIAFRQ